MAAEIYWRNSSVWTIATKKPLAKVCYCDLTGGFCTHRGRTIHHNEASITRPDNPSLNILFPSSNLLRHGAQTGCRQLSWKTNKHSPGWSVSCSSPRIMAHNDGASPLFLSKKFPAPSLTTHSGWQLCSYLANVSIAGPGTEKGNTNYGLQFGGGLLK